MHALCQMYINVGDRAAAHVPAGAHHLVYFCLSLYAHLCISISLSLSINIYIYIERESYISIYTRNMLHTHIICVQCLSLPSLPLLSLRPALIFVPSPRDFAWTYTYIYVEREIHIHIYIYIYIYRYIYYIIYIIYIYVYTCMYYIVYNMCVCICINMYMCIYIYIEREREIDRPGRASGAAAPPRRLPRLPWRRRYYSIILEYSML